MAFIPHWLVLDSCPSDQDAPLEITDAIGCWIFDKYSQRGLILQKSQNRLGDAAIFTLRDNNIELINERRIHCACSNLRYIFKFDHHTDKVTISFLDYQDPEFFDKLSILIESTLRLKNSSFQK